MDVFELVVVLLEEVVVVVVDVVQESEIFYEKYLVDHDNVYDLDWMEVV